MDAVRKRSNSTQITRASLHESKYLLRIVSMPSSDFDMSARRSESREMLYSG